MLILVLGFILIIFGALQVRFPKLCRTLKEQDPQLWATLGSPNGFGVTDAGKTLGVLSWLLNQGHEKNTCADVIQQGKADYKKAIVAKFCFLVGSACVVLGFIVVQACH